MLRPSSGEVALAGDAVYDNARALGKLCLIGDTPDFGYLGKPGELLYVCAGLFPAWDAGYARELMLCVGLASGAQLTVFDEPSLGLDAVMRERFYDLLLAQKRRSPGRTFVLSTHLIDEVARVLDAAVLIDVGHFLCAGTVAQLQQGYLSVSGAADDVRELTRGLPALKEEELAGTLVRHVQLPTEADGARIAADPRVRTAPVSLQRLFVFLTEEKEAQRHAANA